MIEAIEEKDFLNLQTALSNYQVRLPADYKLLSALFFEISRIGTNNDNITLGLKKALRFKQKYRISDLKTNLAAMTTNRTVFNEETFGLIEKAAKDSISTQNEVKEVINFLNFYKEGCSRFFKNEEIHKKAFFSHFVNFIDKNLKFSDLDHLELLIVSCFKIDELREKCLVKALNSVKNLLTTNDLVPGHFLVTLFTFHSQIKDIDKDLGVLIINSILKIHNKGLTDPNILSRIALEMCFLENNDERFLEFFSNLQNLNINYSTGFFRWIMLYSTQFNRSLISEKGITVFFI